ncbi:putative ammonium transporter 1 [Vespa crabro]|uniref:putative ammonium transporter 1 n=1 Tax=Vespa crabro TaxID=7445 RepID=UPI001F0111E5|nr:putative ammonium transporter 1 [Vespa crabro]
MKKQDYVMYPNDLNLFNESFIDPLLSKINGFYSYVCLSNYANRILLTILMRIGFVLLQIGIVKKDNLNFILFKNILDICSTTVAYFTIGFLLIFDGDAYGFIYGDYYPYEDFTIKKEGFLIGWQVVMIASAICTTSMIEDSHLMSHFLVNVLLAGIVQPLLIRWTLMPEGWIAKGRLNDVNVIYRDHAGSGIVHVVGGLSGLIAHLILSKKRKNLKTNNIDRINYFALFPSIINYLGLFLIFVGLSSFSSSPREDDISKAINIINNNLLAACSCSFFVIIIHFTFQRAIDHLTTIRCVQGLVAGPIMISAASNEYSSLMSIGLGCLGGTIIYLTSRFIFHKDLEDHCNVIATHLVCGLLATVLAPVCILDKDSNTQTILLNLSWQLISLIALLVLVTVAMTPLFLILNACGLARHSSKIFKINEFAATTITLEMEKDLPDRNIEHNRNEESIINNENVFSLEFSDENKRPRKELLQMEEDQFIKENYLNGKAYAVKNENLSECLQSSGLHRREEEYTN